MKNALKLAGALLLAYELGRIAGHSECLNNIAKTYGETLFAGEEFIIDKVSKNYTITRILKETEKCNA